ncbi:Gfo/Idh/MocA family protein [Parasedimentitalea marina]|uniref:Gfo/Idh/MocA family protein n=1 Tax=Parasedimentitalea marina TaxID=2483033 RepID=UPI0013E40D94|nr:Gfo/Idh/MocA family oxidoreductase [Parasedimentitalea marina]
MSTATNKFSVAIVGFGWWGKHFANRLKSHKTIHIAGVVEPVEANHPNIQAMGLQIFSSLEEAINHDDVDAAILTTPNPLHEEQVIACANAGKHVFCEKPLGLTADSARRSMAACQKAGVQLGIGHERRFEPALLALKSALDKAELGTIMHAEAAFSHDKLIGTPKDDWRTSKAVSPAAGMTAMGIHLTDLFISFFGRVKTVQAMTASRSLGWETGDVVTAQLGFESGVTATLSAVLHTPHFIRMHVFGTEEWIEVLNDTHPDTPGGKVQFLRSRTGTPIQQTAYDWDDAVTRNLEAFVDAAQGRTVYPFSPEEMVHNIEVLEAITLSAEENRTILLEDI